MKERLLVMNGQRIVQNEKGGQWLVDQVAKAGAIRPGVYNLYSAVPAVRESDEQYEGAILHSDVRSVYQQVGKRVICHKRTDFDRVPEVGTNVSVKYKEGRAVTSIAESKVMTKARHGVRH